MRSTPSGLWGFPWKVRKNAGFSANADVLQNASKCTALHVNFLGASMVSLTTRKSRPGGANGHDGYAANQLLRLRPLFSQRKCRRSRSEAPFRSQGKSCGSPKESMRPELGRGLAESSFLDKDRFSVFPFSFANRNISCVKLVGWSYLTTQNCSENPFLFASSCRLRIISSYIRTVHCVVKRKRFQP